MNKLSVNVLPIAIVIAACALSSGCAKTYMKGMVPAKTPPTSFKIKYQVSACTDLTNGSPINLPAPITYYLADTPQGPGLYEFDAQGNGALINNHWSAEDGEHYFGYVRLINRGFEFVIPADAALPGKRLVYVIGQFQAIEEAGVMKVKGTPIADCPMVPGA